MNYSIDTSKQSSSTFITEDYFPATIEFSEEELNNHFIEFRYGDSDLFEFYVDRKSHILKRVCLTLCNHYSIKDTPLFIPIYEKGMLYIDGPASTECSTFETIVHTDGIEIITSLSKPSHCIKCGQLIIALSETNELTAVLITDLSETDIFHVKSELMQ